MNVLQHQSDWTDKDRKNSNFNLLDYFIYCLLEVEFFSEINMIFTEMNLNELREGDRTNEWTNERMHPRTYVCCSELLCSIANKLDGLITKLLSYHLIAENICSF